MVVASEFTVLSEYLTESGFPNYGLNKIEIAHLAKELFHTWLTFCSTTTTLRNSSAKDNNVCYFVDDSFITVERQAIYDFVKTCPGLLDYKLAARYGGLMFAVEI